jgi:hypothetical protein
VGVRGKPGFIAWLFLLFLGGSTGLQVIQWEEFDLHGVRIRTTAGPLDFRFFVTFGAEN